MFQNPPIKNEALANAPDNSPAPDEKEAKQMIEMAAERVADLIWRHWLYLQEQKKEKHLNLPIT